jgi:hypothetical protein
MVANNQPKENKLAGEGITIIPELCQNRLAIETVNTFSYDENGRVIPLNNVSLSFKCIKTTCDMGKVIRDSITAQFPQCVNGLLIAGKEGYHTAKYTMSTNFNDQEVSVVLEKYMNFSLNISVIEKDGKIRSLEKGETVIVEMKNDEKAHSVNLVYPAQETINLLEGDYSAKLSLFEEGSFTITGKKVTQCMDIPQSGLFGFLGFTEQKCMDFETPSLELEQVFGGGAEFSASISRGKSLNMYLLKTDAPKSADNLDAAYQISQTAVSNSNFKQPQIK